MIEKQGISNENRYEPKQGQQSNSEVVATGETNNRRSVSAQGHSDRIGFLVNDRTEHLVVRPARRDDVYNLDPGPWLVPLGSDAADSVRSGEETEQSASRSVEGSGGLSSQDAALRVLVLLDMVAQSSAAQRQTRDLLVQAFGNSAGAWDEYRRVAAWWSVKVPLAYLLASGVFKFLSNIFHSETALAPVGFVSGLLFLTMLVMAVASSMRLLPLRSKDVPPTDWVVSIHAPDRGKFGRGYPSPK